MTIPAHPIRFLLYYMKLFPVQFFCLLACVLIWSLNEALFPYFIKLMIDKIQDSKSYTQTIWSNFSQPILGITISWILMEVAMRLAGIIEIYLFPKLRAKMHQNIFDHIKQQSINYFASNLSGSIGTQIADIPKTSQHILENVFWHLIAISFSFIFSSLIFIQISIIFTCLLILWCSIHMGITLYFLREIQEKTLQHYKSLEKLNGETNDIVTNAVSIKLFSHVEYETQRLRNFQNVEVEKSISAGWAFQKTNILRGCVGACFILTTGYFLLRGWQQGWLSAGDVSLVAMTSFNLIGLIWDMNISLLDLFRDIGTLNGALNLLREENKVKDLPDSSKLIIKNGKIKFDKVTFGYHEDNPVFSNFSVKISSKEKVGIIGMSGAGKTSFVNLILRGYELIDGGIYIDDQNIASVTQSSLRQQIAVITQDSMLFHRSIKDNISYGKPGASQQEIEEAARKAHCEEFIEKLAEGYNTMVGERGCKLSGGQRQRIAIARAFLKGSPILILDEATSALDSVTENYIQESFIELMNNKTTIVIAHRISTLKNMNRILVFNKGKIIEEGSQEQLMQKQGYFTHLLNLQKQY